MHTLVPSSAPAHSRLLPSPPPSVQRVSRAAYPNTANAHRPSYIDVVHDICCQAQVVDAAQTTRTREIKLRESIRRDNPRLGLCKSGWCRVDRQSPALTAETVVSTSDKTMTTVFLTVSLPNHVQQCSALMPSKDKPGVFGA
jgi:hypothetical protein